MKVRFTKDYKDYKQNKVYEVTNKRALELIRKRIARIDKMMTDFTIVGNR